MQVQNIRYRVGCYVSGYIMRSMPAYPGTESWVDYVMCIEDCLVRFRVNAEFCEISLVAAPRIFIGP